MVLTPTTVKIGLIALAATGTLSVIPALKTIGLVVFAGGGAISLLLGTLSIEPSPKTATAPAQQPTASAPIPNEGTPILSGQRPSIVNA